MLAFGCTDRSVKVGWHCHWYGECDRFNTVYGGAVDLVYVCPHSWRNHNIVCIAFFKSKAGTGSVAISEVFSLGPLYPKSPLFLSGKNKALQEYKRAYKCYHVSDWRKKLRNMNYCINEKVQAAWTYWFLNCFKHFQRSHPEMLCFQFFFLFP